MIQIHVSNTIIATGLDTKTLAVTKKALTIANPAYHKIARMVGPYAAARDFRYFKVSKTDPGTIMIPRGFLARFTGYLDKQGIEYKVEKDLIAKKMLAAKTWKPVELRDYQSPLIEAVLAHDIGVVSAGTGAGKTVLACEVTRRLGLKTTIIVPTSPILGQFKSEFKKWFDYDVGVVGMGEKTIKDVTVVMWQGLAADKQLLSELAAQTGLLIIDECHGVTSKERIKTLEEFRPSRLYGLSGSPKRSKDDGRTAAIFFLCGPIIAKHEATQVVPEVEIVYTRCAIAMDEFARMEDAVVEHDSRNRLIAGLVVGEVGSGKKVLVLCKRRDHCKRIMDLLPDSDMIWYADSDDKERNNVLMDMRNGDREFSVVVGTTSLLATGTDLPMLDRLILSTSIKSDVLAAQGIGRILRAFSGKEDAKVYDLTDDNPIYKNHLRERIGLYKTKGWIIK